MEILFPADCADERRLFCTKPRILFPIFRPISLNENRVVFGDSYDLCQLHPIFESFANALGDKVVAVCVGVEGDGLQGNEQNGHWENGFCGFNRLFHKGLYFNL